MLPSQFLYNDAVEIGVGSNHLMRRVYSSRNIGDAQSDDYPENRTHMPNVYFTRYPLLSRVISLGLSVSEN